MRSNSSAWLPIAPMLVLATACNAPTAGTATTTLQWPVVYEQNFTSARNLADFAFSDASRWEWHQQGAEHGMKLLGDSKYRPPHRSPTSIALLKNLEVADFDLDVDLKQTGRNYGHRDLCLFFGFESPARFYYTHLATIPDPNAHNIFKVHDAPRSNLAAVPKAGIDWGQDEWHHVRIERRVKDGSIRVYWDHQPDAILQTNDQTMRWGRIGFGSFDDSGIVGKIVVRAPMSRSVSGKNDPF